MWLKTIVVIIALFLWTGAAAQDFDTSQYAIITFNYSKAVPGIFSKGSVGGTISNEELAVAWGLLRKRVTEYNAPFRTLPKDIMAQTGLGDSIDLNFYRFQVVVSRNKKGQKVIWINSFCVHPEEYDFFKNWRSEIVGVFDGGSCYFNIKINLKKKVYFDFFVNGIA